MKKECIRQKTPLSLEDARSIISDFVDYYNKVRLHSAIGYITPIDKLQGREQIIFADRDRKLNEARERRRIHRKASYDVNMEYQKPAFITMG